MQECVVGVDVSKHRLDVFDPRDGARQIANEAAALTAFAGDLAHRRAFVFFEATGRYAWPLRDALLLAAMGSTLALRPTAVLSGKRRRIKALGTRRRQLVDMKT